MAKLSIVAGVTSKTVKVFVQNSSVTTGAGLTGLVFNTASLTGYYIREGAGASVSITLATATLGTWATGGFIVVDGTNMPGLYELGIPNAAIAGGAKSVVIYLQGATNMVPTVLEIELTAVDNQDSVRYGLTALPNAAAGANTGLPVVGTQVPNATAAAAGGLATCDATNSVKIQSPVKKNTALASFQLVMLNLSGNPQTGLTVTGQVSIDGAAYVGLTNAVSEVANGSYKVNLAAADVNGNNILLRFSATSAKDTFILLETMP